MSVTITRRVDVDFGAGWVDISRDVDLSAGFRHHLGIDGDSPLDLIAGSGELSFTLRNSAVNSGKVLGYYSPGHANVRTGWDYGIPVRVVYNDGSDRVCWIGKIAEIDPDPNPHGPKVVRVVAYDHQHDLVDADARAIPPQSSQPESALVGAVLDSLPASAQPLSRSIATGLDTVPVAFDKLGSDTKALTAIADVVRSSFGIAYTSGAGAFTYKTRQTRFTSSSVATLTDNDINGFSGPTSREGSYNVVRVTYHPKHETAGIVLWSYTGSTPQAVRAGETITVETTYRDPNQTNQPIGASVVTTPVAGTDYVGKEFADGSGSTLTASLTVTASTYATVTVWEIENTSGQDIYLTTWQLRGTGVFDDGAQTVESRSTQPYGERVLALDLPYQSDRHVAYGMATLIREQRENPTTIIREVSFRPTKSSTLRTLALTADIGDVITLSNTITGVSASTATIQRIEMEIHPDGDMLCTFGLMPITTITTPPTVPTGLAVANTSDAELTPSWTNTDVTAETEIYVNGVFATVAVAGATSLTISAFTRATNYTFTLKHVKYALIRSAATAGVVGRPTVTATGGTVTTPGDGYKYHTFTTSANFLITGRGKVDIALLGGGGGAGSSIRSQIGSGAGAGGDYVLLIDNEEPTSASQSLPLGFPVVIGAGAAGDSVGANQGSDGSSTTYRSEAAGGGAGGGTYNGGGAHDGASAGNGGGGAGEGATGGAGPRFAGGDGATNGSGERPGGGGAGAGGAGGNAVNSSTSGGARGAGVTLFGVAGYGQGGKGGGSAETPANASSYGVGGDGVTALVDTVLTAGKNGFQGIAIFRYPI